METVTALGRDADAINENPLKAISEQTCYRSPFPFPPANCYMLSINATLHLEGHVRDE